MRPRLQVLFSRLVEQYIGTAEPVGSAFLAADESLQAQYGSLSSATIRNDLAQLEEWGLLSHPHTSAGRIPTTSGYRYYVDEVLRPRRVSPAQRARITSRLDSPPASMQDALQQAASILAELTGYPVLASLPVAHTDTMSHLQLNPVPPHRLILVVVTGAGRVEHRLLEISQEVPAHRLATVLNFLNRQLGGRSLAELRKLDFAAISRGLHDDLTLELALRAFTLIHQLVAEMHDERIVVQGLVTLLNEPEFAQIDRARAALHFFDNPGALHLLLETVGQSLHQRSPQHRARPYSVVIGGETPLAQPEPITQFSWVGVEYQAGDEAAGTVTVVGPTRMKYAEVAALLPELAGRLQAYLRKI